LQVPATAIFILAKNNPNLQKEKNSTFVESFSGGQSRILSRSLQLAVTGQRQTFTGRLATFGCAAHRLASLLPVRIRS
jgi:hypothetical protein